MFFLLCPLLSNVDYHRCKFYTADPHNVLFIYLRTQSIQEWGTFHKRIYPCSYRFILFAAFCFWSNKNVTNPESIVFIVGDLAPAEGHKEEDLVVTL